MLLPTPLNPYRELRNQFVDDEMRPNLVIYQAYPPRTTPLIAGLVGGAQWSALYYLLIEVQKLPIPSGPHIWLPIVLCGGFSAPFLTDAISAFNVKTLQFRNESPPTAWHTATARWYEEGARWNEEAARWHEEAETWGEAEPDSQAKSAQYRRYAQQWRESAAQWERDGEEWRAQQKIELRARGRKEKCWSTFMGLVGSISLAPLLMTMAGLGPHLPSVDWTVFGVEYSVLWLLTALIARSETATEQG